MAVSKLSVLVQKARDVAPHLLNRLGHDPSLNSVQDQLASLETFMKGLDAAVLKFQTPASDHLEKYLPPPCYYTSIYEDNSVNVCIFTLRTGGCELPLHNHPGMHGFLKVISGTLSICSMSLITGEKPPTPPSGFSKRVSESALVPVCVEENSKIITASDPTCVFTPVRKNIHQVTAIGGMAAFLDVLIPKYEPPERNCDYFNVLNAAVPEELTVTGQKRYFPCNIDPCGNLVWLEQIPEPENYWCKTHSFQAAFGKDHQL